MDAKDIVQLKYSYVNTFLKKIIEKYQEKEPCHQAAIEEKHEKIPIWVLWWQEEENAPELVRLCLASMRKNLPFDVITLHVITEKNLEQYIELPAHIREKYEAGMITITHLSDVIRFCLLFKYGGLWMDATYFVGAPVSPQMFEKQNFWTQCFETPLWADDVVQGRWSGNLLGGKRNGLLFDFWLAAISFYWERHDFMIDYFLIDYIIAVAYENLSVVRHEIENCKPSQPELFRLREVINMAFDEGEYRRITAETQFFKLSYKVCFIERTEEGKETYYSYLKKWVEGNT